MRCGDEGKTHILSRLAKHAPGRLRLIVLPKQSSAGALTLRRRRCLSKEAGPRACAGTLTLLLLLWLPKYTPCRRLSRLLLRLSGIPKQARSRRRTALSSSCSWRGTKQAP
jgi:hypothetical protein